MLSNGRACKVGRAALLRSAFPWTALLCALTLTACPHPIDGERRYEERFGTIAVYAPVDGPSSARALVFLFSDSDGWNDALEKDARALAAEGVAVVGVDLPQYFRGLAASDDECHYLISEVEDLSKRLERELGFTHYRSPILAGAGAGGTLAYAALAQSPAATVEGAAAIDPDPVLWTPQPLCEGAPVEDVPGGGFRYGEAENLPGWWKVQRSPDPSPYPEPEERLLALIRDSLPPPPAAKTSGSQEADSEALTQEERAEESIADLPLVELAVTRPGRGKIMAVIYSGDGGWRDIDKQIGEELAERGVPVVGVDSLRYFWHEMTPDQLATDLAQIIEYYCPLWHTPQVVLIGYSFGADILPFAYNRLSAENRSHIVQVSLLSASHNALFEFDVSWLASRVRLGLGRWAGTDSTAGTPLLPEVQRMPASMLQCFYGEEDADDTVCNDRALATSGIEIIRTGGGHHFDGGYEALADQILDGVARRTKGRAAAPPPAPAGEQAPAPARSGP